MFKEEKAAPKDGSTFCIANWNALGRVRESAALVRNIDRNNKRTIRYRRVPGACARGVNDLPRWDRWALTLKPSSTGLNARRNLLPSNWPTFRSLNSTTTFRATRTPKFDATAAIYFRADFPRTRCTFACPAEVHLSCPSQFNAAYLRFRE